MTKSYNDSVKQKAREKFRNFIARNLLSFKRSNQVKVVCFPGAEVEGEEALEVREVYDKLGIPRKNIVGLEYNPENAKRLKKANLGIEVVCQNALEFFKTTSKQFDVISLDYTGQRTWRERDTTRYIAGRQLLNHLGVLCTNHAIRRESRGMQKTMLENCIFFGDVAIGKAVGGANAVQQLGEQFDEAEKELKDKFKEIDDRKKINLNEIRDGITFHNLSVMGGGKAEINPVNNILANNPYIREKRNNGFGSENDPHDKGVETTPNYWREKALYSMGITAFIGEMASELKWSPDEIMKIVIAQDAYFKGSYFARAMERYTYVSNKNFTMMMDIAAFKPMPYRLVEQAKRIFTINPRDGLQIINPLRVGGEKLSKMRKKFLEECDMELGHQIPNTNYLGSSWKPKDRINRTQAIDLLQSGCNPREIAECYSGFSTMQLAGFKAHLTMGTYSGGNSK